MFHPLTSRLIMIAGLFAVLVLAGCGGDGDSGVENTLRADLDALQEDFGDLQADLEEAQDDLTAAEERVREARRDETQAEADATQAEADAQRAQQQNTQLQRQLTEAQQAELSARAGKYLEAIHTGGMQRTGMSVTYERGSSTPKIYPGGDFDPGSGAPAISGFTPRPYTRQVGVSGEETVYLYTNIQRPSTRAFWKIHGLEVGPITRDSPLAKPTGTPSPDNAAAATKTTVSGTYDGVSGTFTCTHDLCMGDDVKPAVLVGLDMDGQRQFTGVATWTFTTSITASKSQISDNEYLYFGIWVQEPKVASDAHMFEYITGGRSSSINGMLDVDGGLDNFADLIGTAKFDGGAIGKYVTRNQVGENDKIGTFTANAEFTADFDNDTLEGRIDNFREGDQALSGNWNVYLGHENKMEEPAPLTAAGADGSASARIGVSGLGATGTWSATLYGTANDDLGFDAIPAANIRDLTSYPLASYPLADLAGLVGRFHVTSNSTAAEANAALAGAFGATPR